MQADPNLLRAASIIKAEAQENKLKLKAFQNRQLKKN